MKRKKSCLCAGLLIAAVFILLSQTQAWSAIIKVGTGWSGTQFPTIQAGVDNATAGDEIWVQQGTYTLAATIDIGKAISLYGGFTGSETSRAQRNYAANVTTVDGNNSVRCFMVYNTITIDGFTITKGDTHSDSSDGAGIRNGKSATTVSGYLTLSNCILSNNSSGNSAGALFNDWGTLTVNNCTFSSNTANNARAGAIENYGSDMTITNCTFSGNTANNAGAVYYPNTAGTPSATANNVFTDCVFRQNSALAATSDGGVTICDGNSTFTRCVFDRNTANRYGTVAFYGDNGFSHVFTNCVFTGNTAQYGAAICINGAKTLLGGLTAMNCTFAGNTLKTGGAGGAIYTRRTSLATGATFAVTNCILWGNGGNAIDRSVATNPLPTVSYTDIDQTGYAGTISNSINQNPLFTDATNRDYSLQASSPCIDAGTSSGAPSTDIAGISRPVGSGYDMGAYEYPLVRNSTTTTTLPLLTTTTTEPLLTTTTTLPLLTTTTTLPLLTTTTTSIKPQRKLTVTKAGTGYGTVTGGSINCGSTCTETVDNGTLVVLTATAADNSTFTSWYGACNSTNTTCNMTMTDNKTVTATFTLKTYTTTTTLPLLTTTTTLPLLTTTTTLPLLTTTTTLPLLTTTTTLPLLTTTTTAALVGVFKDDFNGDTKSDILLKNAAGSLYVLAGKADGVAYGTPARIYKESTPATYTVVGTGDFNGDQNVDILLKNAAGSLYVLFGKDDGMSYATTPTRIYKESNPATYSVVGTGDFNNDTHCDILLKNAAGSLYVLYGKADGMSYATTPTRIYKESSPATYTVVGTGDFNGDMNCDILLKNAAGSLYVLFGKDDGVSYATTATRIYKESTPATYTVVGTGDFNGDGNDDVLLKNAAGSLYVLFGKADGVAYATTATRIYKESVPATYSVVGTGDYNGDGNTDILLKNAAGSLYVLFGKDDGVSYATTATRIYKESTPATYSVVGY